MRKLYWVLLGVAVLIVVGVGSYVVQKKWGPITDYQPANPVGLGEPKTFGKIEFQKNIFVQHGAIAIDDGPLTAVACEASPAPFATIKIDDTLEGELSCVDDYLGGVKLTYSVDGEVRTVGIAQRDADGGDAWDARSFILHDKNGHLLIHTQTASSGEEIDEENSQHPPMECSMAVSAQVWEAETKTFVPGPPAEDAPSMTFRPPINVAPDCLNADGSWKGR